MDLEVHLEEQNGVKNEKTDQNSEGGEKERQEYESVLRLFAEKGIDGLAETIAKMRKEKDYWKEEYEQCSIKVAMLKDASNNHIKESSASKPQDSYGTLKDKIDRFSTTINMKVKVIEDLCSKVFKIEEEQSQWSAHLQQFIKRQTQELNSLKSESEKFLKRIRNEIDNYRYTMETRISDYHSIRLQMDYLLNELEGIIPEEPATRRLEKLESENRDLIALVQSQKDMINELFVDRELLKQESDQELQKWKGISSLTVPLVELLNKSMDKRTPQKNTDNDSTLQSQSTPTEADLKTLISASPLPITDSIDLRDIVVTGKSVQGFEKSRESGNEEQPEIFQLEHTPSHSPPETISNNSNMNDTPKQNEKKEGLVSPPPISPLIKYFKSRVSESVIGSGIGDHVDGYSRRACFNRPCSLCTCHSRTSLFVTESGNHCVRKINLQVIEI